LRRANNFEIVRHGDRMQDDRPSHLRRPFSPTDRVSADAIQELLARAYIVEQKSRAYAESELTKQSEQFSAAIAARDKLAAVNLDFEEALDFIAGRAASITFAHGAAIALAQGDVVVCRARSGLAPPLGAQVNAGTGLSGQCLRTGDILCCEDTLSDPRVDPDPCRRMAIRSILAIPVRRGHQIFGIVEVFSSFVAAFGTTEVRTLQLLAGSVADVAGKWVIPEALPVSVHVTPAVVPSEPTPAAVEQQTGTPAEAEAAVPDAQEGSQAPALLVLDVQPPSDARLKLFIGAVVISSVLLSLALAMRVTRRSSPHASAPGSTVSSAPLVLPAPPKMTSGPIQVFAVRFHSRQELTTISIDLSAPVTFAAKRLDHPDRIYFDLEDAAVVPQTPNLLEVNDSWVSKIRIGKNAQGVTRVVVDLKCPCEYSAVVSTLPPFKLVVIVHPALQNPAAATSGAPDSRRNRAQSVFSATDMPVATASPRSSGLKIMIDPGHGGSDLGATGRSGLREKDLVLDIARRLGHLITTRMGAQVVYTREADVFVPLLSRSALAISSNADLFISIHGNSSDSRSVKGVETFYRDATFTAEPEVFGSDMRDPAQQRLLAASRKFASSLQAALYKSLAASDRAIRNRGIKSRALTILERLTIPSVLTEISFLTSPAEEKKLSDPKYLDQIAEGLYRGVATYVSTAAPRLPQPRPVATSQTSVPEPSMR